MKQVILRSTGTMTLAIVAGLLLGLAGGCGETKKPDTTKAKTPATTGKENPVKVDLPDATKPDASKGKEPAETKPVPPKADETPAAPKTDEKPAAPKTDEKPAAPKVDETPAPPKMEEKPAAPKVEEKKEEPKAEEKPVAPKVDETPAPPKMEEKPAAPKTDEKPAAPKVEEKKEEPKAEEKKEDPKATEAKPAEPVTSEVKVEAKPAAMAIPEKHKLSLTPTPGWITKPTTVADAVAADEAAMKAYKEMIGGAEVGFEMLPIKGGKFMMGSPDSEASRKADEGPQHEVEVEPFWMGKYEVTWEEYELWCLKLDIQRRKLKNQEPTENDKVADAVAMPTNPYTDMSFSMGKDGYPAICMTQLAAKLYCKWLSAKTGRYYRLPTEAEWEYACRAGTTTAYSFGADADKLGDYAWNLDNSDEKYHKIGQKKPNPWGLHDMHGNVAEWTLDQYVADGYKAFAGKVTKNPLVGAKTEYNRVVRGGSWDDEAPGIRSAARRASEKLWKQQDPQIPQSVWYLTDATFVGFRVIRPLRVPTAEEAKLYELDDEQIEEFIEYDKAQAGKM